MPGKKSRAFCLYNTHLQTKLRHSVPRQYPGYEKTIRQVQVLDSGLCIERIVFEFRIPRFIFQVLYSKLYIRLGPRSSHKGTSPGAIFYVPCFLVLVLDSGLGTVAGAPPPPLDTWYYWTTATATATATAGFAWNDINGIIEQLNCNCNSINIILYQYYIILILILYVITIILYHTNTNMILY